MKFQAEKETKPEINLKTIVQKEYHDLLNVFLKKNSNALPLHQKYDYKIILKEEQKHGYALLYKMSLQKLDIVKCYLDSHLAKGFIQANLAPYSSLVLFDKKPSREI